MQKLIVTKKFDNKKISDFLYANFNGLSKNVLYKALRKKDIRINNVKINEDKIVYSNDEVTVYIVDELLYKKIEIDKIYEDENILVVNKPNNIEVVGNGSLTELLKNEYSYISPCHRLDRNTKGLVLFAKNLEALNILLDKFKNREIEKHYLAKVYNSPNNPEKNQSIKSNFYTGNNVTVNKVNLRKGITQTLIAYLFKDNKKSLVYISDVPKKGYVKIETSFTLLEENNEENYSIIDVELHTGKTHQIRAHLAYIGFPIIGDGKYGINKINKRFECKTQELYSYSLKFNFKTDSGILNYLDGKKIELNKQVFI